jgi:hypothetical protein
MSGMELIVGKGSASTETCHARERDIQTATTLKGLLLCAAFNGLRAYVGASSRPTAESRFRGDDTRWHVRSR